MPPFFWVKDLTIRVIDSVNYVPESVKSPCKWLILMDLHLLLKVKGRKLAKMTGLT